jgi:hypothetical protein
MLAFIVLWTVLHLGFWFGVDIEGATGRAALRYDKDINRDESPKVYQWKLIAIVVLVASGVFVFANTHRSLVDRLGHEYPNTFYLAIWVVGMLGYRLDAERHDPWWACLTQVFPIYADIHIAALGFTHKSWPTFLIAASLIWLQIQFTKRWWARPAAWW